MMKIFQRRITQVGAKHSGAPTHKPNWVLECFALARRIRAGIKTCKQGRSIRVFAGVKDAAFAECFAPTQCAFLGLLLMSSLSLTAPQTATGTVEGGGRTPPVAPPLAPRHPFAEPPECATKAVFYPREPGWVFVMNFEKFENDQPIGCMKLYRNIVVPHIGPTDYKTGPCKVLSNGSDVVFHDGQATLSGGYIYCDVNIRDTLAALDPPAVIPQAENYRYYTIIAVGAISDTSVFTTYSNPVGFYRPSNAAYPDHGLFLPWSPNGLNMTSLFNDIINTSPTFTLKLNEFYTFTVAHDDGLEVPDETSTVFTTTHKLGEDVLEIFTPRDRVKVWTDGGTFLVGASYLDINNTFLGTLDEVIFDPTDTGRPPASPLPVRAWLPLVMKPTPDP